VFFWKSSTRQDLKTKIESVERILLFCKISTLYLPQLSEPLLELAEPSTVNKQTWSLG